MRKMHRPRGLVGSLVLREADVTVDAKNRPSHGPRIRNYVRANLPKSRAGGKHEGHQPVSYFPLVPRLVLLKPRAVVVEFQLAKEIEERRREVGGRHECLA